MKASTFLLLLAVLTAIMIVSGLLGLESIFLAISGTSLVFAAGYMFHSLYKAAKEFENESEEKKFLEDLKNLKKK